MSFITPETLRRNDLTVAQIYELVNSLSISYLDFAIETNYHQKMYGVITGCDYNCCSDSEFVLNRCLRDSLWRKLIEIQSQAETTVGYNITPRYHTEIIDFPFGRNIKVRPGVSAVDIIPTWTSIEDYDNITVSPYIVTGLTPTVDSGYTYISVPDSVLSNPSEVVIRSSVSNAAYTPLFSGGYPRKVGNNWRIALDTGVTAYDGNPINVQHCKYAFVDVTPAPACVGGIVFPVYKGTNQKIPQAKPKESFEGYDRYWFYIYTLVDPAFHDETTNLQNGEYYKLVPSIEFKCFTETSSHGSMQLTCNCNSPENNCGCSDKRYDISATIVDAANGVISFCVNGVFDDDNVTILPLTCDCLRHDGTSSYKLTFSYKTSPVNLPTPFKDEINSVRTAILHRVGAELPINDCCCPVKVGFIFQQQQIYGKRTINPMTQSESVSFNYGDMHGQKVYADIMKGVHVHKFAFI